MALSIDLPNGFFDLKISNLNEFLFKQTSSILEGDTPDKRVLYNLWKNEPKFETLGRFDLHLKSRVVKKLTAERKRVIRENSKFISDLTTHFVQFLSAVHGPTPFEIEDVFNREDEETLHTISHHLFLFFSEGDSVKL